MNWYVAKIIYNINLEKGMYAPEFDEQLRLIEAPSKEVAFSKARVIGKEGEESFQMNDRKTTINWEFIDVSEIFEVELSDGSAIYSSTQEKDKINGYINFIKQKATDLQKKNRAFA